MKICRKENAVIHRNSDTCENLEYPINDRDINISIAKINGKYPEQGYSINETCKLLAYILDGSGILKTKNETIEFKSGDVILVDINEPYYWDAVCTVAIPCSPAWYPEQYKLIEETKESK